MSIIKKVQVIQEKKQENTKIIPFLNNQVKNLIDHEQIKKNLEEREKVITLTNSEWNAFIYISNKNNRLSHDFP